MATTSALFGVTIRSSPTPSLVGAETAEVKGPAQAMSQRTAGGTAMAIERLAVRGVEAEQHGNGNVWGRA
jgi:hypothetical protein